MTLLLLLGVTQVEKVETLANVVQHIPGKTPSIILGALLVLAGNAGLRLAMESETVHQALNLHIETGVMGCVTMKLPGSKERRVYHIGDVFIINHGLHKVLLRIRVSVPHVPAKSPEDWHTDEEIIYANGPCIRGESGLKLASDVGDVPHLPTDMSLQHDEHIRGHTEVVLDLYYMKHNFGEEFQSGPARLEIEDVLSKQVKVIRAGLPDGWTMHDAVGARS